MAVATSTALIIAAVVAAVGTGYAVREQNMANKSMTTAQNRANTAQAKQLELQAAAERTQATADELDRQKTLQRILAAQNAVFGSNGFDTASTTFGNIQTADTQREATARNLNQIFTDTRQAGIQNNIMSLGYDSAYTRMAGKYTRRANTINGVNSLTGTLSSGYLLSQKKGVI